MSARLIVEREVRRWTRRVAERIGAFGMVGISLLLIAGALGVYTPALTSQSEALREQSDRTRGRLDELRSDLAKQPGSVQRTAQLRESFPPLERATGDLRSMFEIAQKNRIDLAKGEYALAPPEDVTRLRRLEVTLPLKDRYVTIKGFVADVLNAVPHASLAEFRIERSSATVDKLDARVHFTLFYREQ